MLTDYLRAAMKGARYEILAEDGSYYGEIPACPGVYASAVRLELCREELEEVLEDWVLLRVSRNLELPALEGVSLAVKKAV